MRLIALGLGGIRRIRITMYLIRLIINVFMLIGMIRTNPSINKFTLKPINNKIWNFNLNRNVLGQDKQSNKRFNHRIKKLLLI